MFVPRETFMGGDLVVDWGVIKIWCLRWRICRLEARVQKLEEELAKLKGGDGVAY